MNFAKFLRTPFLQNTSGRLKSFLSKDHPLKIANSFVYSNFNYYPLLWHFCSYNWMTEMESIFKKDSVLDEFESDSETLLKKIR